MTKIEVENPDLWLADLPGSNNYLTDDLAISQSITKSSGNLIGESNGVHISQNSDRLIGKCIDQKYLIEALICKQQLSSIYRVSCGDRHLILKILQLDCTDNQELREKFLWQMQAIACIQTQKAVRVLDYGTDFLPFSQPDSQAQDSDSELPYIVTEFCSYPTLADQLKTQTDTTWDLTSAVSLILKLIKSLQSLYAGAYLRSESGAIIRPVRLWHQNLKPSNIFLADLFIQLSDFGGYQLLFLPEQHDWQYAAPEDWQQNHFPRDERRDIYGCGLILYQLLNGKSPYQLPTSSTAAKWQAAITFDSVPNFNPDLAIPRSLELLVLRCLEKDPQHRFANLKQLKLELEEIAQIPKSTKLSPKRSLFQPLYVGAFGAVATAGTIGYIAFQPQIEIQSKIEPETNLAIPKRTTPEKAKTESNITIESSNNSGQNPLVKTDIKNKTIKNPIVNPLPIKTKIKAQARINPFPIKQSKPNLVPKSIQNSTIPSPFLAKTEVQTDKPEAIAPKVLPAIKSFPIPVAKRVELIPPPTVGFFPKPLPQPNTKLIPPPEIVASNRQDQAINKQIQLSIPVSDQNVANFDQLMQSSAEIAAQTINRDFALFPQRQEVQIAILGDRNGQEVPLLLAKVTRSQWQTNGNINKWANFIIKSESLLAAIPAPKANLNR